MVCRSSGLTTCCRQSGSFSRTDAWTPAPGVATGQCWGGPSNVWSGWRCTGLAHQHWLSSALILQDLGVGQYADHGWVEAQLSSGGLSSAWHFGGSNSQVSVSRAFLFPYLEEWGEDRARSFRLHLQVLFPLLSGRSLRGHLIFCPVHTHRLLSGPITRYGWRPKWILCNLNLDQFLKCCLSDGGPGSPRDPKCRWSH